MPTDPSADLVARARNGDREALDALLEDHQAQIYRFGLKMCRDPEDAQDVAQDTLFAMARGVRDFRGGSSISTWLYTIAKSFCIKKRRHGKFAPAALQSLDSDRTGDAAHIADPSKRPDQGLEEQRLGMALQHAIGALDRKYRDVLLLRDVEGLSAADAAAVLGISVEAVKSRLHRARLSLRTRLAPHLVGRA